MSVNLYKCWGSRGLLGFNLTSLLGAEPLENSKMQFSSSDIIINTRESSSKRLAEQNLSLFLAESATKSIELYKHISSTGARLIYFSTLDNNQNLYCDVKRWLEKLPGQFIDDDDYKIVRIPSVIGTGLRKGFLFDVLQKKIYSKSDVSFYMIDAEEIAHYTGYLVANWSSTPRTINLVPSEPTFLSHLWSIVHSDCGCCLPKALSTSATNAFSQMTATKDTNFALKTSEFYIRRYLSQHVFPLECK
jgi:hypothetical protein